ESSKDIFEEGDIVISGDRRDTQDMILESKASLMIITGSHGVDDDVLDKAKEYGCTIITTPYDSFTAARLILQSIPVSYVMRKGNLISFKQDDFVDDIKDIMLQTRYRSYPVLDSDGNVIGSISRYHLISANRKKVILVDHNERSQAVNDLEQADLLEIIDHHRVGDIQTGTPIYFRNEPVGSTSTIISSMFFENGIRPSKKIAGILCAAIISDTLDLKSPTTTIIDKLMLERLINIADVEEKSFSKELFKAGTLLEGKSEEEIFYQDFKNFKLSGMNIGISQVVTMDIEGFDSMKGDMLSLMDKKAAENNYNALVLMLTDILNEGSMILVAGKDKELIAKAFNIKLVGDSVYLPGILSRKKQVVPVITAAIEADI
ncbi:MAG: putative manganese-dependent inorganic diphosphatase, partial [Bacillota bacterium]|nr:putative manganese-dependent inorganic diphosphatase [Bacillota bacterium]